MGTFFRYNLSFKLIVHDINNHNLFTMVILIIIIYNSLFNLILNFGKMALKICLDFQHSNNLCLLRGLDPETLRETAKTLRKVSEYIQQGTSYPIRRHDGFSKELLDKVSNKSNSEEINNNVVYSRTSQNNHTFNNIKLLGGIFVGVGTFWYAYETRLTRINNNETSDKLFPV